MLNDAFPIELAADLSKVCNILLPGVREPSESTNHFLIGNSAIQIPHRVYFQEPHLSELDHLTETQKAILCSIMTLHHSGYARQLWAEKLFSFPTPWTTPFVALLLGDYVFEIVEMLQRLDASWNPFLKEFASQNHKGKMRINARIISYWSCYYRHAYPRFTDYPGYKAGVHLEMWDPKSAPNLSHPL